MCAAHQTIGRTTSHLVAQRVNFNQKVNFKLNIHDNTSFEIQKQKLLKGNVL